MRQLLLFCLFVCLIAGCQKKVRPIDENRQ
ncbi:MAG: hypothetical protein K940chlam6_00720, partial [Chlamydiae bacterium]|nr:hypothetical protein [Chlamydiota bacterium]